MLNPPIPRTPVRVSLPFSTVPGGSHGMSTPHAGQTPSVPMTGCSQVWLGQNSINSAGDATSEDSVWAGLSMPTVHCPIPQLSCVRTCAPLSPPLSISGRVPAERPRCDVVGRPCIGAPSGAGRLGEHAATGDEVRTQAGRNAPSPLPGDQGARVVVASPAMNESARIAALTFQVAELERKLDFVMRHLGVTYHEPALAAGLAEAAVLVEQGDKIGAIKVYQQRTGVGLREANDAIDALALTLGGGG